jgi:hypothetical protein
VRRCFILLQQHHQIDWVKANDKASAAGLAVRASNAIGIVAEVSADGTYHRALSFAVNIPTTRTKENARIYDDAARMAQRAQPLDLNRPKNVVPCARNNKLGRNDPCPCGSGLKYKRCHGL